MPIGDKAILEIVIEQLKYYGFDEIILSIGHLGELFMAFLVMEANTVLRSNM